MHGFDYNFNDNSYFGNFSSGWATTYKGQTFHEIKTLLYNQDFDSPTDCRQTEDGCSNKDSNGNWDKKYGFIAGSDDDLIADLGLMQLIQISIFTMVSVAISRGAKAGSLANHLYDPTNQLRHSSAC